MTRKAEAVAIGAHARVGKLPRNLLRTRRAFGVHGWDPTPQPEGHTESMQYHSNDTDQAWQLIRDDPFDGAVSDAEIERVIAAFSARTPTPYTELLRRLVGLEELSEVEAKAYFRRVLDHRGELERTLGRIVHVRVAALDLLTTTSPARAPKTGARRRDSHPIIVTPALLERAFEEATADGLTGLPQRLHFMNLLNHELRQRKRRSVCVAFIDLDGFKRVNDQHGHAAGDEVLRTLARSAQGTLREGDVLARIGGDEFAVLLIAVTPAEAEAALRRLRHRFEELTAPLGTSFSAGFALAGAGETAERLITRADEAMYREKRARAGTLASG